MLRKAQEIQHYQHSYVHLRKGSHTICIIFPLVGGFNPSQQDESVGIITFCDIPKWMGKKTCSKKHVPNQQPVHIWRFPWMGAPQNRWFILEHPSMIIYGWFGGCPYYPYFRKPPYVYINLLHLTFEVSASWSMSSAAWRPWWAWRDSSAPAQWPGEHWWTEANQAVLDSFRLLPSGNDQHSYGKWPIYSWCTYQK